MSTPFAMSHDALRTALKAGADQKLAEANAGLDKLIAAYRDAMAKPGFDSTDVTATMALSLLMTIGADRHGVCIVLAQAISRLADVPDRPVP